MINTIDRKYVIVVDVKTYTSGNHCAYQRQAINDATIRRVIKTSGINLMMIKINAALKSSEVFMSYLAIVGKIAIVMSNTAKLKKMTKNL